MLRTASSMAAAAAILSFLTTASPAAASPACAWQSPELSTDATGRLSSARDGTSWYVAADGSKNAITAVTRTTAGWQATTPVATQQSTSGPFGMSVVDIAATSGGRAWVAGEAPAAGRPHTPNDRGIPHVWRYNHNRWSDATPPQIASTDATFVTAITASSDSDIYVGAGDYDTFIPRLLHWDGTTWTDLSAMVSTLDSWPAIITPITANRVFVATNGNGPAQQAVVGDTSTGDSTPLALPSPTGFFRLLITEAIKVPSTSKMLASAFGNRTDQTQAVPYAATLNTSTLRWQLTRLASTRFTPTPTNPYPPGTPALTVAARSATDAWIGGHASASVDQFATMTWHFDGSSWTAASAEPPGGIVSDLTDPASGPPLVLTQASPNSDTPARQFVSAATC